MVDFLGAAMRVIAGLSVAPIKDSLDRNKRVIEAFNELGLSPEHPRNEFGIVYQHTLIKYGMGKQETLRELFAQKEVVQAFRQAFEQSSPSIVAEEIEKISQYADDLQEMSTQMKSLMPRFNIDLGLFLLALNTKQLNIDIKQEVNQFTDIFLQVANSTRGPADVIRAQEITKIGQSLASLHFTLTSTPDREWNYLVNFWSDKHLVTFKIEDSPDSMGVKINDRKLQKINIGTNFRICYQIPDRGEALIIEGTQSGWEFIPYCSDKDTISEDENRYIQETIAKVESDSWCIPNGEYPFVEDSVLGLHKFVLILSKKPFTQTMKTLIIEQKDIKLSSVALGTLVKYIQENKSSVKLIVGECEFIT